MANPTNKSLNYLLHNPETDNNKLPLTQCPFFRGKPIKEVGVDAQLLPNHRSGLAAVEPVQDRFAFEGFVEFPALSDRCLFHRVWSFIVHPILCPSIRSNRSRAIERS